MVYLHEDLVVSAARDLLWNFFINTLVSKCSRMMGTIKHDVGYKAPITVKSYLYSVLACNNLEHCSTAWFLFNLFIKCKH